MDRSLRFGSRWCNSNALFGLAFATATALALTSLHHANSQAHSSKGTLSPFTRKSSNGLYAHGFRYSFTPLPGYFSPFPHGTNPLSVIGKYSGLPGGPGRFTADFTGPLLLGDSPTTEHVFSRTGLSPSTAGHPKTTSANTHFSHCCPGRRTREETPHNPAHTTPAGYHMHTV